MKFTKEEYYKKIDKLRPVAHDLLVNHTPEEGVGMAAQMDPIDAYILGRIIGQAVQADMDMKAFKRAISEVDHILERIPDVRNVLN